MNSSSDEYSDSEIAAAAENSTIEENPTVAVKQPITSLPPRRVIEKPNKTLLKTVTNCDTVDLSKDPNPLSESAAIRIESEAVRRSKPKKPKRTYTCNICFYNIDGTKSYRKFPNYPTYLAHLSGKDHLKTLKRVQEADKQFYCSDCKKNFQNNHDLEVHLKSRIHRRIVNKNKQR